MALPVAPRRALVTIGARHDFLIDEIRCIPGDNTQLPQLLLLRDGRLAGIKLLLALALFGLLLVKVRLFSVTGLDGRCDARGDRSWRRATSASRQRESGQRRGADKEDKASLHGDSLVLGKGIATALASNQDYFEIYSAGMGLVELATVTLHNTKGLTVQEYQI